jgi:nitronate monooxygenase
MAGIFHPGALAVPIVQAPMAGGPSTPELAIAVSEAGALGFLAAGYKQTQSVREDIDAVRASSTKPFGVNLFVPTPEPADPASYRDYLRELEPEAARQGVDLDEARFDDDEWENKLRLVREQRVPVVSFTFGCPDIDVITALHDAGIAVWVTITNVAEAASAQRAGADALIVQGTEAGGHRGSFTDDENTGGFGLLALLRLVSRAVPLPLIATGGIADGHAVASVLCAGASAAQIGTALMLAPEAGTTPSQRALTSQAIPTQLTRAFTGRLARGITNRFLGEHSATAPIAYPEINNATRSLRGAARQQGDTDAFNLWAGQAHELARDQPAGELIRTMDADVRRAIDEARTAIERPSAGPQLRG